MELVSVIIPTYNRGYIIAQAILSVLAQTYREIELLVVDDHSTDTTATTVAALASNNQRIRYLSHDINKGAQAARNTGIYAAHGAWIAFLDSDDQWFAESLAMRFTAVHTTNAPVVYSGCQTVDNNGIIRESVIPSLSGYIYQSLLTKPGPMFQSLLVTKEALQRIGYLDEHVPSYQEWETAIRLAEYYPFAFVTQPTFLYNRCGNDMISKNTLLHAAGYEYIVKKHRRAILKEVGRPLLAKHYLRIAALYQTAGKSRNAFWYNIYALWYAPQQFSRVLRKMYREVAISKIL